MGGLTGNRFSPFAPSSFQSQNLMGRRSLPSRKTEVDLGAALIVRDDMADNFDAVSMFGRTAPLEIEIGSGKGLFLRTAASAHPDRDFFGVEVVKKYAYFIADKLVRDELPNARILHGDGIAFLKTVPDESVDALHVYFPDPWWKKRHRRRRVLNESFFESADRILKPGGKLHFWTDVKEYFDSTLELMETASKLIGPLPVEAEPALHDMDYRTHFERRVRMNDLPVYRAEFYREQWRTEVIVGTV